MGRLPVRYHRTAEDVSEARTWIFICILAGLGFSLSNEMEQLLTI